jgi:hypothetical protein
MTFVYISWGILATMAVATAIHLKNYYKAKKSLGPPSGSTGYPTAQNRR